MKKLALAFLGLTAVTAFAAPRLDDSITDLNAVVADLLKPYQTVNSKAEIAFQTLTTDETNVLTTSLTGAYLRIGTVQSLSVRIAGLTFDMTGPTPVVNVSGNALFDFTKLLQRDQLNALVDSAEGLVADLAGNYTRQYGEAASVKGTMIEKTKDADGNYSGFRASVSFRIDMSKLPAEMAKEDVLLLNGVVFVKMNLTRGMAIDGNVMLNPDYKGFHGQGNTLKMALEKLLARDEGAQKTITGIVEKLDKMAAGLVDASTGR